METISNIKKNIIIGIAMLLGFFHLYTASFGTLPSYFQSSMHWAFIGSFIIIAKFSKNKIGRIVDTFMIVATCFISYYLIINQADIASRAGLYTTFEIGLSILAIVIGIEIARRVIGLVLPVLCGILILYAMYGSYMPGVLSTASFSLRRIGPYLLTGSDGLFGQSLFVSAQFIFLFVLFGSILDLTGAGNFFVDLAYSVTGRISGGPAQAAVVSSMFLGSINGSGAANVVTTGTFTIPLMKKVGYRPAVAGAVEAVASNGGQIMPPVMGAAAFLMAEMTGLSYGKIVMAAIIPAALYYLTLCSCVYLYARENDLRPLSKEELPSFVETFKKGWLYLVPLAVLIVILMNGMSPQKAAFYSIVLCFVVGFIKDRNKMSLKNIIGAFEKALSGIAPIAAACLLAGIVMGIINMTGLGIKISGILEGVANGNLLIALLLTMVTSLILGMGLPTSAAYLVLAVLVGPALIKMGVSTMAAHLFLLYFGALSTITPPVALSTFAAAGIAGSNVWETGIESMKLASAGFIIPFIFAYNDVLLLNGTAMQVTTAVVTALLGCIILSVSLNGWFMYKLKPISRIALLGGAIMLIIPSLLLSLLGGLIVSGILFLEIKVINKNSLKTEKI